MPRRGTPDARELIRHGTGPGLSLLAAAVYSGLDVARLLALRWKDVDLAGGQMTLVGARSREDRVTVPILPSLARVLMEIEGERPPGQRVFTSPATVADFERAILRPAADKAGLHLGRGALRESFVARWTSRGAGLGWLAKRLGLSEGTVRGHRGSTSKPPSEAPAHAWRRCALHAIEVFTREDSRSEGAIAYAYSTGAVAELHGWHHDGVRDLLNSLYRTRNPDGGYGLGRKFAPFRKAIANPPDTSYVVTMAGHVGRVLLAGRQAGVVSLAEIARLTDLVAGAPRVASRTGTCIGYSTLPHDADHCVHNVNATAAWFLSRARAMGFGDAGTDRLVAEMTLCEVAAYRPGDGAWRYDTGRKRMNDINHNAGSVQAMLELCPPVGRHAGLRTMQRRDYGLWTDSLGQVRLLPFFPTHSLDFIEEFEATVDDPRQTPGLLAQHALWAARAATGLEKDRAQSP